MAVVIIKNVQNFSSWSLTNLWNKKLQSVTKCFSIEQSASCTRSLASCRSSIMKPLLHRFGANKRNDGMNTAVNCSKYTHSAYLFFLLWKEFSSTSVCHFYPPSKDVSVYFVLILHPSTGNCRKGSLAKDCIPYI
jgi:hypothetical protein